MKAVILYDQFERAALARSAVSRAASKTEDAAPLELDPWRIDLLAYQTVRDVAIGQMLDADLVVLALAKQAEIAATLWECLEHWAERRHVSDAGLGIFQDEDEAGGRAAGSDLCRFAARYGLSFISATRDFAQGDKARFADDPDSLQRRQVAQTAIMQQMLARTGHHARRL